MCSVVCPPTTFANILSNNCDSCGGSCLNCVNSATNCLSCSSPTDYFVATTNSCNNACPSGQYSAVSSYICKLCDSNCA